MNRSRFLFFLASIALLVPIISGTLAGAVSADGEDAEDSLFRHLSVFSEVLSLVRRTYVDETSLDQLFAGAMDGSTDALDPLATYIPAEATDQFRETLRVGSSHSGMHLIRERGIAYVLSATPGGPAAAAGLRTGDILSKLDGESTRLMPLWRILGRFAEPPGTELAMEILRRGQVHQLRVTLGDFAPPAPVLETRNDVPVLRLGAIEPEAVEGVAALLDQARTGAQEEVPDRLIVDLRGVSEGQAEAAYALGDLFVDGELGTLRSRDRVLSSFAGTEGNTWQKGGRLVVLTDRGTQGASEILAAILVQGADAELVGERTFGHAGRHRLVSLSTGAQVYLTDAYYTGPSGELLDTALEPQVQVSQGRGTSSDDGATPATDPILDRALDLLDGPRGGAESVERDAA
jgi:carboxyl-terminal processing protease